MSVYRAKMLRPDGLGALSPRLAAAVLVHPIPQRAWHDWLHTSDSPVEWRRSLCEC